jgi:biotin transporter BioY
VYFNLSDIPISNYQVFASVRRLETRIRITAASNSLFLLLLAFVSPLVTDVSSGFTCLTRPFEGFF